MDRQRVESIQLLRALAASLVVGHHVALFLATRSKFPELAVGAFGVDIFFPISGFVICLTAPKLTWKEFLVRRIARVVPIYWVATIAKVGAVLLVPAMAAQYR